MDFWVLSLGAFAVLVVTTFTFLGSRYRRCPSDSILVVYGRVGAGQSARS